jgi:hypothetical protein
LQNGSLWKRGLENYLIFCNNRNIKYEENAKVFCIKNSVELVGVWFKIKKVVFCIAPQNIMGSGIYVDILINFELCDAGRRRSFSRKAVSCDHPR